MKNNNIPAIIEGPPPVTSASSCSWGLYLKSTIDHSGPVHQKVQVEVENAPILPTGHQPCANEESDNKFRRIVVRLWYTELRRMWDAGLASLPLEGEKKREPR